jgi:hypothetical protein
MRLARLPLAYVTFTLVSTPYTMTLFFAVRPLAIVHFSVTPGVDSDSTWFIVHEITLVCATVVVPLIAFPVSLIGQPATLVDPLTAFVYHDPQAMPHPVLQLPPIDGFQVPLETKQRTPPDLSGGIEQG